MKMIEENIGKISALCSMYKVNKLFVFGSVLTPRFNAQSDVDMVVDFKEMPLEDYADNYINLRDSLVQLLQRDVDLLEERGIHNHHLRANINRTRQLIYG